MILQFFNRYLINLTAFIYKLSHVKCASIIHVLLDFFICLFVMIFWIPTPPHLNYWYYTIYLFNHHRLLYDHLFIHRFNNTFVIIPSKIHSVYHRYLFSIKSVRLFRYPLRALYVINIGYFKHIHQVNTFSGVFTLHDM